MSKCGRRGYRKRIFSALQGERLHAGGVEGRECLHMKHASVMHEWMMKFLGNFLAFSALVLKIDITDWLKNFFSKSTNLTCKFFCNRFVRNQVSRSFANVQMHSCTCTFSTYTHVIFRSKRAEYSRPSFWRSVTGSSVVTMQGNQQTCQNAFTPTYFSTNIRSTHKLIRIS